MIKTKFSILFATIALAFGWAYHASGQITIFTNTTVWVTNTVQVLNYVPPSTNAPVISGPVQDAWDFVTTQGSTNWMIAGYGIYSIDSKKWGGGLGVGYKLSDFVVPTIRLDYLANEIWMPSGNLQLQVPITLFGKVTTIPFAFAGVATCVSGTGSQNGTAVGMLGIGMAARVAAHWDIIADWETWTGGQFHNDNQIRGGIVYKF